MMQTSFRTRRALVAYRFVVPLAIVLLLVNFYPMLYSLFLSVSKWDPNNLLQGPTLNGLANFEKLFRDPRLWGSMRFMLIYVLSSLALEVVIGMGIALLLNSPLRARGFFRSVIILPMAISPLVAGLTWRSMLNHDYGVVNYSLSLVGVEPLSWLSSPLWSHVSIILVSLWQNMPFVALVLLAGLQAIPTELIEAARIDGATPFQVFRNVTIPLLRPTLLVAVVIRATNLVRMFDLSYVLTGGGPFRSTETFSFVAYMEAFSNFQIPYAAAVSWFIFLLNAAITIVMLVLLAPRSGAR